MAFAHRIQPRHVLPLVLTRDLDFWPHVLLEAAPLRGTFFPKIGRLSVLMAVLLPDFCESCEDLSYSTILVTTVVRAYRPIAIMHSSKIGKLIRQLALRRGVLNYILVDPLDTTFLRSIFSSAYLFFHRFSIRLLRQGEILRHSVDFEPKHSKKMANDLNSRANNLKMGVTSVTAAC